MLAATRQESTSTTRDERWLVWGSEPWVADFVAVTHRRDSRNVAVLAGGHANLESDRDLVTNAVVCVENAEKLEVLVAQLGSARLACVCIVSTFRVHLGDAKAAEREGLYVARLKERAARVVVFRPGHVVRSAAPASPLRAVVPANLKSCFVEADELFVAIENELQRPGRRKLRVFTLLGRHRPWHTTPRIENRVALVCLTAVRLLLEWLLLGWLAARVLRRVPGVNVDTLYPADLDELLALYNPYNARHVKVVGYNNGVVHFGHQYPGKTVVSTVRSNQRARVRDNIGQFDCGVTIRRALDVLAESGKELHVVPNYSYVSLGTAFFVPIHGSASTFCTVGETITKVTLYDPAADEIVSARVGTLAFGDYLFNLSADVLLLRLELQVKDKGRYFMQKRDVLNPPAATVWEWFHDASASNVEVRKAGAATPKVTVYTYYVDGANTSEALELPRDRLGRLWDRLEENPLTSVLFHALSRRLAHHVELFMSEAEFTAFWNTHGTLPIAKIQLRFIRRDGFPHSPFRDYDCISADLFMRKAHRPRFEAYLRDKLPAVRMNPGKHSRG